jgi:DNA gyrase subunit A
VKIVTPQVLGRLHLEEAVALGDHPAPARLILPVQGQPQVLAFTSDGRVALLRWEFAGQQPGLLERFLPDSLDGCRVVQVLPLPEGTAAEGMSLGLLSSDGRFKRLPLEEFQELSGRAATVLKLKDGVSLRQVVCCRDGQELVVASSTGRVLRLAVQESQLPLMGRAAQGPMLLRLLPGEAVVGAACVDANGSVLLSSRLGHVKRLEVASLRSCQRGDLGQIGIRFQQRDDALVALCSSDSPLVAVLVGEGRSARLEPADLELEPAASGIGLKLELRGQEAVEALVPLGLGG